MEQKELPIPPDRFRRTVLLAAVLLGVVLAGPALAQDNLTITLLYTNDEHGWLLPHVQPGSEYTMGGAANLMARLTLWEGYAVGADGYLLLSGGDLWTGPAISTWFDGESTTEVLNAMGYTAAAIGNHEFDFGREALLERISQAEFTLLSANIHDRDSGELVDFAMPYLITTVSGVAVGVVGLTTTSTSWAADPRLVDDLEFMEYEGALRRWVPEIRDQGAEIIVVELATAVADLEIAVMGGGHCREVGSRANEFGTVVFAAGWGMNAYGRVDLELDPISHQVLGSTVGLTYNAYLTADGNPLIPDPEVAAIVDYWQQRTEAELGEVIGYTESGLVRPSWAMGNWVLDSWLWAFPADIALCNWGGFRADLEVGEIDLADLVDMLPFDNQIVAVEITGADLVANLERAGTAVAGLSYVYHWADGRRVVDAVFLADGRRLDEESTYRVLITDFMYVGGGQYLFDTQDPVAEETGTNYRQPAIDWTRAQGSDLHHPLEDSIDHRARAFERPTWRRLGRRVAP
jgi:2',3'-cyclic-nucleotide 2'-phosphodiesterase (5'-nucleotidase family)